MNLGMLRSRDASGLLVRSLIRFQTGQIRSVMMATRTKKNHRRRNPTSPDQVSQWKSKLESRILDQNIKKMQELAKNLKLEIKKQKEKEIEREIQDIDKPIEEDSDDVDILYTELLGENTDKNLLLPEDTASGVQLFNTPAKNVSIPPAVLDILGDSVTHLVSLDYQNWNAVIVDLHDKRTGFKSLQRNDISKFLAQIPIGSLNAKSINFIVKMLQEANIRYNELIYEVLMKHFAEAGEASKTQELYDTMITTSKIRPSKFIFGHLIKAHSKTKDVQKINTVLNQMYANGIEPSVKVYTNVLKLCVELNDMSQAEDVFQMMKFRSVQSKPDIEAYNTILEVVAKNGDLYKAMDLYNELQTENIQPTVFTLNSLARTCSKNKRHILKGWEYIIEIDERNLEPNLATFETMLRLAAKDGDLEFSRALYLKIWEMRSQSKLRLSNESLTYLLMAYRDFKSDTIPQLFHYKQGLQLRQNTLALVDFVNLHKNVANDPLLAKLKEKTPPFLPLRKLSTSDQIIAESNALWAFNLINKPEILTNASLITFLRIAVEHGDKDEFLGRFEQFTYPNKEVEKDRISIENPEEVKSEAEETKTSPPAIEFVKKVNMKLERNSELYTTLLSAGKRFQNTEMCELAWSERGRFRKTSKYEKLPLKVKRELDFRFAKEMVYSLIELNLLYDAANVVKTSTKQFKWNFYTLKPLYLRLLEIGDKKAADEISLICERSKIIPKR